MTRWKPERAGILNVWEYDAQEFRFADGRLILRGPNGSGKSNALALLFPFLLDATMSAARMDPFAGGRSMKALLLSADRDGDGTTRRYRHDQRTGYVWLELGNGDEYRTLGAGVRATTQRDAEAWFFVTEFRPGFDLDLAPDRIPLTQRQLGEVLKPGSVFTTAEAYRDAVDRELFGIGRDRYRNLVELVLRLRRPHLAGRLHLDELSKVLSDGLPALDPALVTDVAASFDDLEAVQRDLARLAEATGVVQAFTAPYLAYLRTEAAARAHEALDRDRACTRAQRALDAAGQHARDLDDRLATLEQELRAAQLGAVEADARRQAHLESPAYLDALSLRDVLEAADRARAAAARAADRLAESATELARAESDLAAAHQARADAHHDAERALAATIEAADRAGIAWTLRADHDLSPDELQRELAYGATERTTAIGEVRGLVTRANDAAIAADAARATAADSAAAAETAQAAAIASQTAAVGIEEQYLDTLAAWAEVHAPLVTTDDLDALRAVVLDHDLELGELSATLAHSLAPHLETLTEQRTACEIEREQRAAERADRQAERDALAATSDPGPDPTATRPADRAGRAGAPLYACCDFAPGLAAERAAAVEAALEAAGLLDAWLLPGGTLGGGVLDAFVVATGEPIDGPALGELLVATPPAGSGLRAADIDAALARISTTTGPVVVGDDGHYRLGPLAGRYTKPEPEYIGATARAARRARLLAQLDREIAGLDAAITALIAQLADLQAQREAIDRAQRALPEVRALADARRAAARAEQAAATTAERAAADDARAAAAAATADDARAAAGTAASRHALTPDLEALDDALRRVADYERRAHDTVAAVRVAALRDDEAERRDAQASRARDAHTARRRDLDAAEEEAHALDARVQELQLRLGPDADEPVRALQAIEQQLGELRTRERELLEARRVLDADAGAARTARDERQADLDDAHAAREVGFTGLRALQRHDLREAVFGAGGAGPPLTEPVALARAVAGALDTVEHDDAARDRARDGVLKAYRRLMDELRHGYEPSLDYAHDVMRVEVVTESGALELLRLGAMLAEQLARQQDLLSERERELFERHLLSRVAEALRELLNTSAEFVAEINECLRETPTASGLRIELRWQPTVDDSAHRSAIGLLHRSPEMLGPGERDRLRDFFRDSIRNARANDPGLSYEAVLQQVLDYRAWHTFTPHLRTASGHAQPLTPAVFRTLSGGEQAVALHLPLFAAAAAHYRAARPGAPRLIALDEAFAGIDERMRGELMGLLVRFDLDVIMTGHELWGAYEEVPAVAVYDLLRRPPAEGVSALALRWDGARLVDDA